MAIPNQQGKSTIDFRDNRRTTTRITVRIPKELHKQPVISQLISYCGITVNIGAAQLNGHMPQSGNFDLELRGTVFQIASALTYLNEMNLEILHRFVLEEDGW
ncbi:MAG: NIL domain-containing protein [Scytonema sp. RU_4_4]|nr:NIL domain-containing protein [Scytonema sp. RU_4_4]NJR74353.1 NIL domain-containing protein [Scytonema sp. CRU_2_7]